jgi:hypothetical protein
MYFYLRFEWQIEDKFRPVQETLLPQRTQRAQRENSGNLGSITARRAREWNHRSAYVKPPAFAKAMAGKPRRTGSRG